MLPLRPWIPLATTLGLFAACDTSSNDVVIAVDAQTEDRAADPVDVIPDVADVLAPHDIPLTADTPDVVAAPDVVDVVDVVDVPAPFDRPALTDVPALTDLPDAGDVPGRCATDGDCRGETPACDLSTGRCVACVSDTHCGAGRLCVGNLCVAGCTTTQPCPSGQSCCTGACVDTGASAVHCGTCGTVCRAPNAAAACMNGVCGVGMCTAGFGDCNRRVDDGCEARLNEDSANCGACGTVCPLVANTASAGCAAGRCGFICASGFADCDNSPSNGCEVDLRVTAAHCGLCGNTCPARPNATAPVCATGRCMDACNPGFGDCDGNAANGCEANLATNPAHCGACGARPSEVCDGRDNDCDGMSDEACPSGLSGLTSFDFQSPAWGGGGGSAYNLACPGSQFVTGIIGRSGDRLDAFGVVCGTPSLVEDRSVMPFRYRVNFATEGTVGPVGGGGGSAFRYDCPANSVVMRVHGRSGSRVDQVRVDCYRWDVEFSAGAWRIVRSATTGASTAYGGGGGSTFDYTCASASNGAPSAMRRAFGASGSELDRLAVWCTWPILTLR